MADRKLLARRARERAAGAAQDAAETAVAGSIPDARALLLESAYFLGRAEHHEGRSPAADRPVDIVLALDGTIEVQWSGQVRTLKARRIDIGLDGQPRGIQLTSLTDDELAAMDAEEPLPRGRGTGEGAVYLVEPASSALCGSCGKDAVLCFVDSATSTPHYACLAHAADIAYDVAVTSTAPDRRRL